MTRVGTAPAVQIDKVTFSYGGLKALDTLSLNVTQGLSFGLLGPNGAGKTTLIRMVAGLLRPKTGSIQILGQKSSSGAARLLGYMPQLQSLYNELSIKENVDFFAQIYLRNRAERVERVEATIRLMDLWPRRNDPVTRLSGGMRQRVSLACAIVHNPPLLLLDEPTVGLDPDLRVTFWHHFRKLTSQGTTLIISSHTMDDAAHCDRLAFIRAGKVIAEGAPSELRGEAGPEATLEDAFIYFIHREDRA